VADPRSNQPRAAILTSSAFVSLTTVARQSGWWPYCLIQKCSRTVRALPHQNAPVTASLWQSVPDGKQRLPPKRSHRLGAGPGPACPGGGSARPAFLFDRRACFPVPTWRRQSRGAQRRGWEERSHPEPRAARSFARAWRGWRAPDLPRSEHRGTLPPVEDRASAHPLRSVTSRNRRHAHGVRGIERCLPRHFSRGYLPKHHFMRQRLPPGFHPAL
jgi:hypothetical protein